MAPGRRISTRPRSGADVTFADLVAKNGWVGGVEDGSSLVSVGPRRDEAAMQSFHRPDGRNGQRQHGGNGLGRECRRARRALNPAKGRLRQRNLVCVVGVLVLRFWSVVGVPESIDTLHFGQFTHAPL